MQDDKIELPPTLDLHAAEHLLETLRAAPPDAVLDASDVTTLTSPCAQIVVAALKERPLLSIANPSETFVSAFADLALDWRNGEASTPAPDEPAEPEQMIDPMPAMASDGVSMIKRILTIDDSRTIRDMLNLTLSEAGYHVLQAVDGQDGVDMLGKERVDLVITDINMPKMDGYAVIRHMRSQAEHQDTPILVLTTESEAAKRNIAREAGATGWMVKPFDPERLIATINKVAP